MEEEINFRKVVKEPIRWFGLIYPYFFILILVGGLFYVDKMGDAYVNSVPPSLNDTMKVIPKVTKIKGSMSQGVKIDAIRNPSTEMKKKGQQLYVNNCSSCHGQQGIGDGPAAAALNPKPRNFSTTEGWKNERNFYGMYKTLQQGIPGTAMTAYEYLPAEDRIAIINHITTIAELPAVNDEIITKLEQDFSLSKGQSVAAQIPVDEAMKKMTEESLPVVQKVYSMVSYINNHPDEPGVRIFNRVAVNKVNSLTYLQTADVLRKGVDEFIRTAIRNSGRNGFNSGIVYLTKDEWTELYNFLSSLQNKNNNA